MCQLFNTLQSASFLSGCITLQNILVLAESCCHLVLQWSYSRTSSQHSTSMGLERSANTMTRWTIFFPWFPALLIHQVFYPRIMVIQDCKNISHLWLKNETPPCSRGPIWKRKKNTERYLADKERNFSWWWELLLGLKWEDNTILESNWWTFKLELNTC